MKLRLSRIFALVSALLMLFALAACGQSSAPAETSAGAEAADAGAVAASGTEAEPINVMVLNGTTGFGMANLIYAAENGGAAQSYNFSVETDAANIMAALINGSADIAALPTNAAATLYGKTDGAVQVLALNTRGVLYLVTDSSVEVSSIADLKGLTVYAPAQNPSFIFQYLCEQNGLTVGEDIIIDNTYAQPTDLNAAVSVGEVHIAVLPEPMVTIARSANESISAALDLTAEWDKVAPAGSLVQGCVAVRRDFAKTHMEEVKLFLDEYAASVDSLSADIQGTAEKIETAGIFSKAAIAAKAIPNCNICFITGSEMQSALSDFLEILYSLAPSSVGGSVPGDDFYCILK